MLKPIEEGCMAVIINSWAGNNGICVTVGKYLGYVKGKMYTDQWEIDRSLQTVSASGSPSGSYRCASERCLMRIDGGEFEEKKEQQSEKI